MFNGKLIRSENIKDVIHIKVKKYAGYFNPESKSFAVDPHLTSFEDLQKILVEAFNLNGPFHITYLCRDDIGENVFLSMLTDWDLDAAFMTSSDPHLRLKVDAEPYKDGLMSKMKGWDTPDSPNLYGNNSNLIKTILQPVSSVTTTMNNMLLQNAQKSWVNSLGGAFNKLAVGWGYNSNQVDEEDFFPAKIALDDAEFRSFLGENGRLTNPEGLRLRVYNGGVAPALRKVVWRLLLNIFPQQLTGKERIEYMKRKTEEYESLRSKWQGEVDLPDVEQISNMVWKDVLRTDRSHPFYQGSDDNPNTVALMNILTTFALTHSDVSYCQGMSDLVSPILMVMNNEAQAYICFCGLMVRLRDNFSRHGKAMSIKFKHLGMLVHYYDPEFFDYLHTLGADNMFFCYRWILLEMKREFSFDDAIKVLEVMWSSLPPQSPDGDLPLEDDDTKEKSLVKEAAPADKQEQQAKKEKFLESPSEQSPIVRTISSTSCGSFEILDPEEVLTLRNPRVISTEEYKTSSTSVTETNLNSSPEDSFPLDNVDIHHSNSRSKLDCSPSHSSYDNEQSSSVKLISTPVKLPPPEELGCGNPFLLFVCLAVLLHERDKLISEKMEYDGMVMHFDKMVRKHSPTKVLSRAMKLFAEYLRADVASS